MKIYRNGRPVLGMAKARNKVVTKIDSLREDLISHFARCVGYGPTYRTYNDWMHEIATYLTVVHMQEVKYGNSKLKASQYEDLLFDGFGHDSNNDAYSNLLEAQSYCRRKSYDYIFEIEDQTIIKYSEAAKRLVDACIPIFVTTRKMTVADFEVIVKKVLT